MGGCEPPETGRLRHEGNLGLTHQATHLKDIKTHSGKEESIPQSMAGRAFVSLVQGPPRFYA